MMSLTGNLKTMVGMRPSIMTMRDLMIDGLQDIYYAEQELAKALTKMEQKATQPSLKQAFERHQQETVLHAKRLEDVFAELGETAGNNTCEAIEGLIAEAEELAEETEDGVRDQALIFAGQGVEAYEIARYSALITMAERLQAFKVVELLQRNLQDETDTAEMLQHMASQQS
jgi:ferritin-like metal-binding protein YciE